MSFISSPVKYEEEYGKKDTNIGHGTYGKVFSVKSLNIKNIYAIKEMKQETYEVGGIHYTSLREIAIIKILNHPNIIEIKKVYVSPSKITMIMPLANGTLKSLMAENHQWVFKEVKDITYQILRGVTYYTSLGILNRDLKPDNILYYNEDNGKKRFVITDFGLSRSHTRDRMTPEVYTMWYRAPEILLGMSNYDDRIESWAIGTIICNMIESSPLFPGDSQIDQLFKIFRLIGTPDETTWPGVTSSPYWKANFPQWKSIIDDRFGSYDSKLFDLIKGSLTLDPSKRLNVREMYEHPYFDDIKIEGCEKLTEEQQIKRFDYGYPKISDFSDSIYLKCRLILLEWLAEVAEKFNLKTSTLMLVIHIIDTFMSKTKVERNRIQLYGISAIKIASDFIEL